MISANFRDFSQQEFNASDFNWLHEGIVFCKVNVTTHQSFILKQLALQIITAKFKWSQMMPSFDAFLKSAIKPMLRTCPLSCFRMEYWKIWRVTYWHHICYQYFVYHNTRGIRIKLHEIFPNTSSVPVKITQEVESYMYLNIFSFLA